jgi:quinolinate synthase
MFHKLRQRNPHKRFIEAPTAGDGATCRSCAHCPWMAMNELSTLAAVLRDDTLLAANEILVDPAVGERAMVPLNRMLAFGR